jgi:hypothetical protein
VRLGQISAILDVALTILVRSGQRAPVLLSEPLRVDALDKDDERRADALCADVTSGDPSPEAGRAFRSLNRKRAIERAELNVSLATLKALAAGLDCDPSDLGSG